MRCFYKVATSLMGKNVGLLYLCTDFSVKYRSLEDVVRVADDFIKEFSKRVDISVKSLVFIDNEHIGDDYLVFRFRAYIDDYDERYIGIRVVSYRDEIFLILATIDKSVSDRISEVGIDLYEERILAPSFIRDIVSTIKSPPGQRYIPTFVIYRILGQPEIDIETWRLRMEGEVERELEFSYEDIFRMPMTTLKSDFHCVTGWSVSNVEWEGVKLNYLTSLVGVRDGVSWVRVSSVDGYSTIIPFDDFCSENALLVIKMNGRYLSLEQGYPARIFIPHLYGWKGAKWVNKITFLFEYVDGYWEALGYHERGNVFLEERFKYLKRSRDQGNDM
jgi:DMSO/TMAO reductase YedYZ molybdopterin-dependent catalytic subunit